MAKPVNDLRCSHLSACPTCRKTIDALSEALDELRHRHHGTPQQECPLSARQLQILAGKADGLSVGQIARRVRITENTIKQHLRNARKALGYDSASTTLLVAVALRNGWIK